MTPAEREELLGTMAIGPLLFRMAIPATAAMMTNALYNVVDTIFLRRWVGPHAIGGLSIAFPIQIILLIPFILILPIFFGLSGVWIAFPAADAISTTITILWLRHALQQLRLVQ